MCWPYKIEFEIETEAQEALLKDVFVNTDKTFTDTRGPIHEAASSLLKQLDAGIAKHMQEKHGAERGRKK